MKIKTLTDQEQKIISQQLKYSDSGELVVELTRDKMLIIVTINHDYIYHSEVGTSFMGQDEIIGICDRDTFEITSIECFDENGDEIKHCIDSITLSKEIRKIA